MNIHKQYIKDKSGQKTRFNYFSVFSYEKNNQYKFIFAILNKRY